MPRLSRLPTAHPRVWLVLAVAVLAGCQTRLSVGATDLTSRLGVARAEVVGELAPRETPDAVAGREVFVRNCSACHGPDGRGNGPLADKLNAPHKDLYTDVLRLLGIPRNLPDLPSRPANFHNVEAMRLNTPVSMYETVTRGRPHTAMPGFGPRVAYGANRGGRLEPQQVWHAIFFEWSRQTSAEQLADGQRVYTAQCASCHGASGDGRGPEAGPIAARLWAWARGQGSGIFTDFNWMAQRNQAVQHEAVAAGPTGWDARFPGLRGRHAFRGRLTEAEIWDAIGYLWTFVYRNPEVTR